VLRGGFLFVLFFSFWLALSGQTKPYLLVCGALTSAAIVIVLHRKGGLEEGGWMAKVLGVGALTYLPWLLAQVVKANISVIRVVWSPDLPIDPRMVRVEPGLKTGTGRTILANSITLTPGTVSVTVDPDHFSVHALTERDTEGLQGGDMEQRVAALSEGQP
jgi:multicomponent Na+:H+ antiporter subunit E